MIRSTTTRVLLLAATVLLASGAAFAQDQSALPPAQPTSQAATPALRQGIVPSVTDGVQIHYEFAGDGPVTLVFVHCWSCDENFWSNQVAAFAPQYQVVLLDLAGHGQSGRDRKEWTIEAFAGDVKAVVEKLDLKQVILVGHSMGGPVCVAAAGMMPDRVIEVVGVDTMQDVSVHPTPEQIQPYITQMKANFPGLVAQFVRTMFPAGADTALVSRVTGEMASAPPEIAIPAFENMFKYDLAAGFAALKCPIREINSDQHPTNVTADRQAAKDFDVVVVKGVGHFIQLERPEEFNADLAQVIRQVAP
jgi:pimeloyl-ACP methyl ester carboxylesterase